MFGLGHIWLSELGGAGHGWSGGGTGICGWGQGHTNQLAGPRTGPDREPQGSVQSWKVSAGTGPQLLLLESFPWGWVLCHHTGTTCYYCGSGIPGGDIQGNLVSASRKRKQSCSEEGSLRMMSSPVFRGGTQRGRALSLLFGQGTIFCMRVDSEDEGSDSLGCPYTVILAQAALGSCWAPGLRLTERGSPEGTPDAPSPTGAEARHRSSLSGRELRSPF